MFNDQFYYAYAFGAFLQLFMHYFMATWLDAGIKTNSPMVKRLFPWVFMKTNVMMFGVPMEVVFLTSLLWWIFIPGVIIRQLYKSVLRLNDRISNLFLAAFSYFHKRQSEKNVKDK